MENIGQPINKDFEPDTSSWEEDRYYGTNEHPDIRTLDELLRLAELRLEEVERRPSLLETCMRARRSF